MLLPAPSWLSKGCPQHFLALETRFEPSFPSASCVSFSNISNEKEAPAHWDVLLRALLSHGQGQVVWLSSDRIQDLLHQCVQAGLGQQRKYLIFFAPRAFYSHFLALSTQRVVRCSCCCCSPGWLPSDSSMRDTKTKLCSDTSVSHPPLLVAVLAE